MSWVDADDVAQVAAAAVGLTNVVPFLVEDELQKNGGDYSNGADLQSFSVQDGNLITGQNPASSEAVAHLLGAHDPGCIGFHFRSPFHVP